MIAVAIIPALGVATAGDEGEKSKSAPALAAASESTQAEPEPAPSPLPNTATVSFRNDVMPVLIKAGCNLGACHGAMTGKADLSLSLLGENPIKDHAALLDGFINLGHPKKGALLAKPTLDGVEHQGGKRFDVDSESYRILLAWIREGAPLEVADEPKLLKLEVSPAQKVLFAPQEEIRIKTVAHFSDGSKRDVSRWAVYEPSTLSVEAEADGLIRSMRPDETTISVRYLGEKAPVRVAFVPERPGFAWENPPAFNFIDKHLHKKWRTHRLNPSEVCDDATFVRRVYLDLVGVIPTAIEAKEFVADPSTDKRARLVDELLQRDAFADFWALKWADLLRVEEKLLDRKGVAAFHGWIRQSIIDNKPLDQFAREILTGKGSTYQSATANYYRALRKPDARAEAVAQVFLGTRLACAKCHNHPFEKWTQDDYYEFAAIFDGLDYDIIENKRKDKNDKSMFIGEQVVKLVEERKFEHPQTGKPPQPRLLGMTAPLDAGDERFDAMAEWLTAPENPLFARVQANRIWAQLMGRGLVEPIDDFRATNPPVNPALLDALTADFVAHGFDLKYTVRTICGSRAYQLSSLPTENNADDSINFTHQVPARLIAEQILDSAYRAIDLPARFGEYPKDVTRAVQVQGVQSSHRGEKDTRADDFLKLFGKSPRLTNSDTERANDTSLAQIFELTSGSTFNKLLTDDDNRLSRLLKANRSDAELVDELSWTILTRAPSGEESSAMSDYLATAKDRRRALEDLAWSMLNAKEFILRR
jgi:hypothetical protein